MISLVVRRRKQRRMKNEQFTKEELMMAKKTNGKASSRCFEKVQF